jgi:tRNA(Ile)-lysidine synthase
MPLSARHRAALSALAGTTDGTRSIDLPGGQALREYDRLRLGPATRAPSGTAGPVPLKRGESVSWHGWRITLDVPADGLTHSAAISEADASRLLIRARRPGDRVSGRGKVQDLFVNAKVPSRLRDTWPLVTLDGEEILWVPGVAGPVRSGPVSVAAGLDSTPVEGTALLRKSSDNRRVASNTERRPRGGNREPA